MAMVRPLKRTPKTKKKPVVIDGVVGEIQVPSPELSQSDLARKKLAALRAAGEVAEAKRLKDRAALEEAAKELKDCVIMESKAKLLAMVKVAM